jgi:hypothetical protein
MQQLLLVIEEDIQQDSMFSSCCETPLGLLFEVSAAKSLGRISGRIVRTEAVTNGGKATGE